MAAAAAEINNAASRFRGLFGAFFRNPVLMKELQIGLREKKVFTIQIVYMIVIGIVAFFYLLEVVNRSSRQGMQDAGRGFFIALCMVQWILVVLISPSLTSTAISSEREKNTLEMLLVSLLSPVEIILGKLAFAVSYIFLLLASSLPLVALVFFLGGVSPLEILINYTALMLWGTMVSIMSLFFSSREQRSSVATNSAYGVLVLSGMFISGVYLPLLAETGKMLAFSTRFPDVLGWLALYFNIAWAFLFFFFKTANNLRPRASYVLKLHNLFTLGFAVNIFGVVGLVAAANNGQIAMDQMAMTWAIFLSAALFYMGCFIERHRFLSGREEEILSKSMTSRPFFFPAYFVAIFALLGVFYGILSPGDTIELALSLGISTLVLLTLIFITREIYLMFAGKIRPVLVYYSFLLLINIVPLISWVISDAVKMGSSGNPSILSLIFIQPIFSIYAIWKPDGDFGKVSLMGSSLSTIMLAFIFFISVPVMFRIAGAMVSTARKAMVPPTHLPPPAGAGGN